jgi:hypothetical protein
MSQIHTEHKNDTRNAAMMDERFRIKVTFRLARLHDNLNDRLTGPLLAGREGVNLYAKPWLTKDDSGPLGPNRRNLCRDRRNLCRERSYCLH